MTDSDTLLRIRELVSQEFGVKVHHLVGPCRSRPYAYARFAYCYLAREYTGASLHEIAKLLGERDHTTILYGVHRAEILSVDDAEFCEALTRTAAVFEGLTKAP